MYIKVLMDCISRRNIFSKNDRLILNMISPFFFGFPDLATKHGKSIQAMTTLRSWKVFFKNSNFPKKKTEIDFIKPANEKCYAIISLRHLPKIILFLIAKGLIPAPWIFQFRLWRLTNPLWGPFVEPTDDVYQRDRVSSSGNYQPPRPFTANNHVHMMIQSGVMFNDVIGVY